MTNHSSVEALAQLPAGVRRVRSVPVDISEPFVDTVRRFAHLPGTVALMSGGTLDCARYHILGAHPWMTIEAIDRGVRISHDGGQVLLESDPFDAMRMILRRYAVPKETSHRPLAAGLLGYLSYDLKDFLEELPRTSVNDLLLPDLYLSAPSFLLVQDRVEGRSVIHLPVLDGRADDTDARLARFEEAIRAGAPRDETPIRAEGFASPFERREYMDAVETIREYIADGHVYQVNMSQRFQSSFEGDPFELYARMHAENPAPFFAYLNAGDHQVLSTSPERFISLDGNDVETRPIKGTRPRGGTPEEDLRMKEELTNSPKDDAELSMIVDLLRNDIGKVCSAGSVRVTDHKRLEAYENVYHLVTVVKGTLDEDKDAVDLLRATFPGGSITGCPKIRSMEIIDELEPVRRHIYTGSIGYLGFHGGMDLSIAIRTATVTGGRMVFSVGGGIVYDSNPGEEYEETLHKGRTLMRSLTAAGSSAATSDGYAWFNGIVKPLSQIAISPEAEGFLYGYGFFETLRVQCGCPVMLDEHIARFNRAWRTCFPAAPPPDVTWDEIIRQVILKNGLSDKVAVVKILAAAGKPSQGPRAQTLLAMAREYHHRLEGKGRPGLRLAVYPHGRQSPLASHKTMNYMLYKQAGLWAAEQGADEAVILDADHSVSETNTANIFCILNERIVCPESKNALPGTMEEAVRAQLAAWDRPVETRRLSVEALKSADRVFLTNSLMGAVPVLEIEEAHLSEDDGLCQELNRAILGREM